MPDSSYQPRARADGLLAEEIGEELLVFDSECQRAHSLNITAARVWRACNGERDLDALAAECELERDTLLLALERLRAVHLLDDQPNAADGDAVSRRTVLRRGALVGAGLGFALPVIRSITAPTPAMAVSHTVPPGAVCVHSSSCSKSWECSFVGSTRRCCGMGGHSCSSANQCCRSFICTRGMCVASR